MIDTNYQSIPEMGDQMLSNMLRLEAKIGDAVDLDHFLQLEVLRAISITYYHHSEQVRVKQESDLKKFVETKIDLLSYV